MRAQVRRDTIAGVKNETGVLEHDWRVIDSKKGPYAKKAVEEFEKRRSERLNKKVMKKRKERVKGNLYVHLLGMLKNN